MTETDIARLTRERDEAREALARFLNEPCKDCLGYEAQMSGMEDAYRDSERGRRDAEAEAKRMSQAAAENFDEAVAAQEAALAAEAKAERLKFQIEREIVFLEEEAATGVSFYEATFTTRAQELRAVLAEVGG